MATKRVLVIDDEPDVQVVVRGCLEDIAGWEVVTVASGYEGLAQVAACAPDAIVLDMMMPGMDGLAFLKALRTCAAELSLPVVLLTAKVDFLEADDFSKLGVKGVIEKPFEPFLLVEQVANFLDWPIEF